MLCRLQHPPFHIDPHSCTNRFEEQRFGSEASVGVAALRETLQAGLARELAARQSANALASVRICDAEEAACEALLEREQRVVLPSTTRFAQAFQACRATFAQRCIGPGAESQVLRMKRMCACSATVGRAYVIGMSQCAKRVRSSMALHAGEKLSPWYVQKLEHAGMSQSALMESLSLLPAAHACSHECHMLCQGVWPGHVVSASLKWRCSIGCLLGRVSGWIEHGSVRQCDFIVTIMTSSSMGCWA